MVVETARPSVPFLNSSHSPGSAGGRALARGLRAGKDPPSASRRSRMYFISGLFSAGL
jgi:hypothetical protein